MEQVYVIAKASFVSQSVGSVSRTQRLLLSKALAHEFVVMGLVDYAVENQAKVDDAVKKQVSAVENQTVTDGQVKQSASLPVETALPTTTLSKRTGGRPKKAGK